MFKRVLIANRGEIARRVIRSCTQNGISTVAVYSEADRAAPHVKEADASVLLGPPQPAESYLRGDRIIQAALETKSEAIHPGYGFLAENPHFAHDVEKAGLAFIGPTSEAIELMGDKLAARQLMTKADVPVIPGSDGPLSDVDSAVTEARQIGLPVMLKAAAGGGGKGMRIVRDFDDIPSAFRMAQNEAKGAFGDDRLFMERYIDQPRHIEFQVLGDGKGGAIHLGERECSIQRRHQKLIEECPSTALSPDKRQEMGKAAEMAAAAVNYRGAGTVEFIYENTGHFYFLEMNTRLQVEHPVTEMVFGIDLVESQLKIAAGEGYGLPDSPLEPNGWSIECRILAEDPFTFLPVTGRINHYIKPEGNGVRLDSGIEKGLKISPYYDSLIGKLIVHSTNRRDAARAMQDSLSKFVIAGLTTNIPLHHYIMGEEIFLSGDIDTHYLSRINWPDCFSLSDEDEHILASIAVALKHEGEQARFEFPEKGPWRD